MSVSSSVGGSVSKSIASATTGVGGGVLTPSAPVIQQHPANTSAVEGSTATFVVGASGYPAKTYQWRLNSGAGFSNISGATGTSYTTPTLALSDDGNLYDVVVTNSEGSATSNAATLTVTEIPSAGSVFLRPGGVDSFLRPGGVDTYLRP